MEVKIRKRIQQLYSQLGGSSRRLADYLLQHALVAEDSVNQLAAVAQVSPATISRFARMLGFKSFSQLKWALIHQLNQAPVTSSEVKPNDSPQQVAQKVLRANTATLEQTFELLQTADLKQAVKLIVQSQRLGFFGMGGSNIVAQDAYHKFLRVPLTVLYDSEYHLALMQASRLTSKDCAILISHTGDNRDTLLLADVLKKQQVPLIVITSTPHSQLTQAGDVCFFSIAEGLHFDSRAFFSMTSQLAITDCLYLLTAQHFGSQAADVFEELQQTVALRHQIK
ncbi:MAG: MurR/RpiR family transcriptional regulator [Liquorilactobacillus nagelii]|uniref:MurR/RpiR family transcriptional regulator n=1 Tax=Liquorilactobacillus nagelii TaxID=82688 RepID=UPI00242D5227|nr:MurR/RpiR family transcriptional regulator [Liquorilactobacillus nagelii]MCI1633958.1 MurR/RpiR family transcriptional regulator [Liquorilactobacillus nagelii]MCI1920938.1 MurR/RpiR family transcriptional regulator [Liquorilactobacillus nagelii]MCI1976592.1 MurR/RpiR family transcriptional regulator [Liquorilactobacillus nagelii]